MKRNIKRSQTIIRSLVFSVVFVSVRTEQKSNLKVETILPFELNVWRDVSFCGEEVGIQKRILLKTNQEKQKVCFPEHDSKRWFWKTTSLNRRMTPIFQSEEVKQCSAFNNSGQLDDNCKKRIALTDKLLNAENCYKKTGYLTPWLKLRRRNCRKVKSFETKPNYMYSKTIQLFRL